MVDGGMEGGVFIRLRRMFFLPQRNEQIEVGQSFFVRYFLIAIH